MVIDPVTGLIGWRPSSNQVGSHDVIVRVKDKFEGIALESWQIVVEPGNQLPVITTDAPTTTPVINQPWQYQWQGVELDGEAIQWQLDSADERATINPQTGLMSWTPQSSFYPYTPDGTFPFTVTAVDQRGGKTSQSFDLAVLATTPGNSQPVITSTPRALAKLDSPYFYNLQAIDPDGDPLSYSLKNAPQGLVMNSSGEVFWQPTAAQFGRNLISLEVKDGRGGVVQQNFAVEVVANSTNTTPAISSTPKSLAATVGQTYSYNPTGIDSDGDLLFWSLDSAPTGMVIDPETGALRWTPTTSQIGSHEVALRLADSQGSFRGQAFTLTVRGTNLAPQIITNPKTEAKVEQIYTHTVVAQDLEADTLSYRLIDAPEGMEINSESGEIQWLPDASHQGSVEVSVEVTDALGRKDIQTYTIEVGEPVLDGTPANNSAPTIISLPQVTSATEALYQYQVSAVDPEGDAISYTLIEAPEAMEIDGLTGLIQWYPTSDDQGTYSIVVGAVDSFGAGVAQQFNLSVAPNNPPVILSMPVDTNVVVGQTYRYDLKASDAPGERLSYQLITAPEGMTIDELGRLRWLPNYDSLGVNPVSVEIRDGSGAAVTQSFELNVTVDNIYPTLELFPSVEPVDLGQTVTLFTNANDNVGIASRTLTVDGVPVPLDARGNYSFTPTSTGDIEVVAIVKDKAGNLTSQEITLSVLDYSDVDDPVVEFANLKNVTTTTEIIGTANDDNLDYYSLSVALLDSDNFTEIFRSSEPVVDGVLGTFDPSIFLNDSYTLRLTAVDGGGNEVFFEEIINVEGDLKLGNFQLSFTDLSIPVSGIPVSVTRSYDSLQSNNKDDFGYGWRLEFRDTNLRTSLGRDESKEIFDITSKGFSEGDKVYITLPGGKRETFTFKPELDLLGAFLMAKASDLNIEEDTGLYRPTFVSEGDSNYKLTVDDDFLLVRSPSGMFMGFGGGVLYNPADPYYGGKYTLTTGEGIVYEIDAKSGDLLTATDTNGNKLTFNDAGIVSDTGVEVRFGRDASGRITRVIDPEGNEIQYQYDARGDLVAVTDRENNTTRFEYHEARAHYLDEIIDPLGREAVRTEYDQNGRLSRVIDVNGEAVELVYDTSNDVQTVSDVFGNETTYVYDERGNVLTEIDTVGLVTSRTYDDRNNMLSETVIADGEEYTTYYGYDSRGNLTSFSDAEGNFSYFQYDSRGNVTKVIDAAGMESFTNC